MFEGQPKGLYALALANTGERFGYYTMLAIFTLFLQAKFGFTAATTSTIFASFLAGVYFMPLIGGILPINSVMARWLLPVSLSCLPVMSCWLSRWQLISDCIPCSALLP